MTSPPKAVPFRAHRKGFSKTLIPIPNRQEHGAALKASLIDARDAAIKQRAAAQNAGFKLMTNGLYVQFTSPTNIKLKVEALEARRGKNITKHIEVVAFNEDGAQLERTQCATVFVPDTAVNLLLKKFQSYEDTPLPDAPLAIAAKKVQRHHDAFDRVSSLRLAPLSSLWTDDSSLFPSDRHMASWEVWLRNVHGNELADFRAFAKTAGIAVDARTLAFDDRTIVIAHGTETQMASSMNVLSAVAELRAVRAVAVGIDKLNNFDSGEYATNLIERIQRPAGPGPTVCIIDTGVNRGHPLLADNLNVKDMHAVNPSWGAHDDHGHGTEMAGLALFGNLAPLLLGSAVVEIVHGLESVKLLPPSTQANAPQLYGALTAEAVSRPEVHQPGRTRVFAMAITSPDTTARGAPTSWSAAVDALAAGRSFDPAESGLVYFDDRPSPRLLVVSAGNVRIHDKNHLDRSDVSTVEDPGQAWNAITVGAHTDFGRLIETDWPGGRALARPGELSPWSRTSLTFEEKWPIKPDVVFEGSNLVLTSNGQVDDGAASLNVVTTHFEPQKNVFALSSGTSAATAQVARIGARISAAYPALWPETVRALIVHSARWTTRMLESVPPLLRRDVRRLVRRYGLGVPSEDRAVRSAKDALTLVHESTIHPFANGRLHEMHVHELPWPKEALAALGATNVILRVSLSYFIEPNPSRRGLTSRYRYPSHGLRFDLKKATETVSEFRKRINGKDIGDEEERADTTGDIGEWRIGGIRNLGSLHSDLWLGSAADLAERGVLAVYPVSGWWKDLQKRDRSGRGARYALIVSIETEELDVQVDLWTPVAQQVPIAIG